ncbi:MAG: hypothetical protein EOO54_22225 [Haliea sp.]|nr:MAG: hypothetical protein EOO54_22225 [Haliea sp.]
MPGTASINQEHFRRILARNIGVPLAVGVVSAALFVGLILYLLSTLTWVEHTERTIGEGDCTDECSYIECEWPC